MSPARSRRSASHAAGTHGWLPQKTGRPGLRRGGVGGYNLHQCSPEQSPRLWHCGTPTTSRLYPFITFLPHFFLSWTCCLPTPLTLVCGGSPIIPLLVYQPAYPSIWAAGSVHKSRGDNVVRMWVQLLLFAFRDLWKEWGDSNFQIFSQNCQFHHRRLESEEMMCVVCVDVTEGA